MHILYFAWLRERVGHAEDVIDLPVSVTTVAELVAWLRERSSGHAAAFAHPELIRCAINQEFAASGAKLSPGDEIAFFPPVTGG